MSRSKASLKIATSSIAASAKPRRRGALSLIATTTTTTTLSMASSSDNTNTAATTTIANTNHSDSTISSHISGKRRMQQQQQSPLRWFPTVFQLLVGFVALLLLLLMSVAFLVVHSSGDGSGGGNTIPGTSSSSSRSSSMSSSSFVSSLWAFSNPNPVAATPRGTTSMTHSHEFLVWTTANRPVDAYYGNGTTLTTAATVTATDTTTNNNNELERILAMARELQLKHFGSDSSNAAVANTLSMTVESCRWLSSRSDAQNRHIQSLCISKNTNANDKNSASYFQKPTNQNRLLLYNPWPRHERLLCGHVVAATAAADTTHEQKEGDSDSEPKNAVPLVSIKKLQPLDSMLLDPSVTLESLCNINNNSPTTTTDSQPRKNNPWRPPTLFPVIPTPQNAHSLPPIVLTFANKHRGPNPPLFEGCNVPCRNLGDFAIVTSRTVDTIDRTVLPPALQHQRSWEFIFSMEGEAYYPNLKLKPMGWKENKYWATTSYRSEIPLPYYSRAEYTIQSPASVEFDTAIRGAVFMARNCDSKNNREQWVRDLSASSFRTESIGHCLHNAEVPAGVDLNDKMDVMRHYLFYLAFENQCVDDYITEKLWGPMEAGTLPIYYGAPNIHDHVPPNSIINVRDYKNVQELVDHLNQVASNKTLYESYHAWRKLPMPVNFQLHYNLTDTHSTCRMCRWAYARMYGIGWNHTMQELAETKSPRQVCLSSATDSSKTTTASTASDTDSSTGLIGQPFVEVWMTQSGQPVSLQRPASQRRTHETNAETNAIDNELTAKCTQVTDQNRVVLVDQERIRRTVRYQDGVVDLLLEKNPEEPTTPMIHRPETIGKNKNDLSSLQLVLRLQTPIQSTKVVSIREGVWRMQDAMTRYTLLSIPSLQHVDASEKRGAIDIVVDMSSLPVRMRIIVEDIDTFHEGADQAENFFGNFMTDDFFNPLELFVAIPS